MGAAEDVPLRHEHGWEVFSLAEAPSIGTARLTLPGTGAEPQLVVEFDPTDPSRLVGVRVGQPHMCAAVLNRLLGAGVAEAITTSPGDLPRDTIGGPLNVDLEYATRLGRLAFTLWYDQWTPVAARHDDCLIDIAVAAEDAGEIGLAAAAFHQSAERLSRLLGSAAALRRSTPDQRESPVTAPLRRAGDLAVLRLGERHPWVDEMQLALNTLDEPGWLSDTSIHDAVASFLDDVAQRTVLGASRAAFALAGPAATYPVDWLAVPPRVLATDDAAVRVARIQYDGADELLVVVAAHELVEPESEAAQTLLVRLVDRETGETAAAAPLRWDAEGRCFLGRFDLSGRFEGLDIDGLDPDVISAGHLEQAAVGAARSGRSIQRSLVRLFCTIRLGRALAALNADPRATVETRKQAEHAWGSASTRLRGQMPIWADSLGTVRVAFTTTDAALPPDEPLLAELIVADRLCGGAIGHTE